MHEPSRILKKGRAIKVRSEVNRSQSKLAEGDGSNQKKERRIGRDPEKRKKWSQVAIPVYWIWTGIRGRCLNIRNPKYPWYGGRGILICGRWKQSAQAFSDDMGPRPSPDHSIDRRNNNGHYSCGHCEECITNEWPANCRWATPREQCNNTRRNRVIYWKGENKTLTQLAGDLNIPIHYMKYWLRKGWTVEKITDGYSKRKSRK